MRLLTVDTSTPICTVGVALEDRIEATSVDDSGETHARHVMDMIQATLTDAGLSIRDIDGFGVITGPGTFTGLRIGIGTIKGLALAISKPVAGITSLDALATQADQTSGLVCPVIDARRREVYYGFYQMEERRPSLKGAHQVNSPAELAKQVSGPCRFIGKGARLYQDVLEKNLGSWALFSKEDDDIIQAATMAKLTHEQLSQPDKPNLYNLTPYYIRKSDAEVNRHP